MVSSGLTLLTITIVGCYLVTGSEPHWKWHKPYAWDGPPKYLRSAVYKPKLPAPKPLSYSPALHEKPYSPAQHDKPYSAAHEKPPFKSDHCELRKVIFTQEAESPQVYTRARVAIIPFPPLFRTIYVPTLYKCWVFNVYTHRTIVILFSTSYTRAKYPI